jgi:protein SCO1/2
MNTQQPPTSTCRPGRVIRPVLVALVVLITSSLVMGFGSESKPVPGAPEQTTSKSNPAMVHRPLDPEALKKNMPEPMQLAGAGIVERLNQEIPGDIEFIDEQGNTVLLGSFYDGKRPILLNPGYFGCPMLCGEVSNGLVEAVQAVKWIPGDQYQILTVSLSPDESHKLASHKKNNYMAELGMPGADKGWRFLVVKDQANADRFIRASGFGFKWNEIEKEFAHAAGIILLMPDGRISRYLYGVRFAPDTLRLSLVEAGDRQIGSTLDRVMLFCFQFDRSANRYTVAAMRLMKAGGAITVVLIVGIIGTLLYREAENRSKDSDSLADAGSSSDPNHPSSNAGA